MEEYPANGLRRRGRWEENICIPPDMVKISAPKVVVVVWASSLTGWASGLVGWASGLAGWASKTENGECRV